MAFRSTIDWNHHWRKTERDELTEMQRAGKRMATRLETYFETLPQSIADVGCGPAFTLFELASRQPAVDCVGFDTAESIVRENRSLADWQGLENVTFRTATLPAFDCPQSFHCLTCIATLHYVADIEAAIENLFAAVEPGGTLIFNYPNRNTRNMYLNDVEVDSERFELVLNGENLLTYHDIRTLLNRQPRSFWKAVDVENWESVGRTNPCVVVEK